MSNSTYRSSYGNYCGAEVQYYGLYNQGETGYLNSVLQVLFRTEDFRAAVERHYHGNTAGGNCLDCRLQSLFDELKWRTAKTHSITKCLGIDRVNVQDAVEYFEKILSLTNPDVSQVFRGLLTNRTICSSCGTETDSDGPFWHLPLTLVDSDSELYSVVSGIEDYFRQKHCRGENQLYCDSCHAKSNAVTKRVIKNHPEVLMLLLKRFTFDYKYMQYIKINSTVIIPDTLQIPENQIYELYAVVDHFGSLRGGHYSATINVDGEWYTFNDSSVTKTQQVDIISSSAYLLFYKRTKGCDISSSGVSLEPSTSSEQPTAPSRKANKIYQVIVNGMRGEKMFIDLCNTEEQMQKMTVLQLKEKIIDRLSGNYDVEDFRLIFTDKMLDGDSKLLSSYGIQHKSMILLVMRVPGGGCLPPLPRPPQRRSIERSSSANLLFYKKTNGCDVSSSGVSLEPSASSEQPTVHTAVKRTQNLREVSTTGNFPTPKTGICVTDDRNDSPETDKRQTSTVKAQVVSPNVPEMTGNFSNPHATRGRTGKVSQSGRVLHGLYNQGATCYLNCVLQVLFMTKEIHDRLTETQTDRALKELFTDLQNKTCGTETITRCLSISDVKEQRDAAHCLMQILRRISEEASKVFQGRMRCITTCCQKHSIHRETKRFLIFPLSLKHGPDRTYCVEKSFQRFFQPEAFTGNNNLFCIKCGNKTAAETRLSAKYPDILTVLLKRFDFDVRSDVKSKCPVKVPRSLELENKTYELYGIVDHTGSLRAGHYTATILSSEDNMWYQFNDEHVSKVPEQPFAQEEYYNSQNAYLLMYSALRSQRNTAALCSNVRQIQQVIVYTPRGEKMTIDLCNTEEEMQKMTVLQLKEKIIEEIPEYPEDILQVIFEHILEDDETLGSCEIQHMSTIDVVLKVRGGGGFPPAPRPPRRRSIELFMSF